MASTVFNVRADIETPETGIDNRKRLATNLGGILADTYLLLVKTHGYHWNVVGPLFVSLHELSEQHYQNLFEAADDLAERIRALGYPAPSSITEMMSFSEIKEDIGNPSAEEMICTLIHDHEVVVRRLRAAGELAEELKDAVTADMLTERMEFHEKAIWMLKALLAE